MGDSCKQPEIIPGIQVIISLAFIEIEKFRNRRLIRETSRTKVGHNIDHFVEVICLRVRNIRLRLDPSLARVQPVQSVALNGVARVASRKSLDRRNAGYPAKGGASIDSGIRIRGRFASDERTQTPARGSQIVETLRGRFVQALLPRGVRGAAHAGRPSPGIPRPE